MTHSHGEDLFPFYFPFSHFLCDQGESSSTSILAPMAYRHPIDRGPLHPNLVMVALRGASCLTKSER